MNGIRIKAAEVTVLALEGGISPVAEPGWRVFHGGRRRRAHLALRRREVLAISHANENRPGAPSPLPANSRASVEASADRPAQ